MLKKLLIIVSAILLITAINTESAVYAAAANTGPGAVAAAVTVDPPYIIGEAAILIDAGTGQILYAKNEHEKLFPASITKILTALLALEKGNLDHVFTADSKTVDIESGSATAGIKAGEQLTVEQLLNFALIHSGNDAANALGQYVGGGDLKSFCDLMNTRAKELGCVDSYFWNANGLNTVPASSDMHKTSAYDMSLIMKRAMEIPEFVKIISTYHYHTAATNKNGARDYYNSNKMINKSLSYYYKYCIGGKTGWTTPAGNTLVTCAEKDGRRLICVIMKDTSYDNSYKDSEKLYDYGFDQNNFSTVNLSDQIAAPKQLKIRENGKVTGERKISANVNDKIYLPANMSVNDLTVKLVCPDSVNSGDNINAYITVDFNGNVPKNFSKGEIKLPAVIGDIVYYQKTDTQTNSKNTPQKSGTGATAGTNGKSAVSGTNANRRAPQEGAPGGKKGDIWTILLFAVIIVITGIFAGIKIRKYLGEKSTKINWRKIYGKKK